VVKHQPCSSDGTYTSSSFDVSATDGAVFGQSLPDFTVYNNNFYQLNSEDLEVYVYDNTGTYTTTHFGILGGAISNTIGITYYNNHFYITQYISVDDGAPEAEVYKYTTAGVYVSTYDLTGVADYPGAIEYYDGSFYILVSGETLYQFNTDFNLIDTFDVTNSGAFYPSGMTVYDDQFWMISTSTDTAYLFEGNVPADAIAPTVDTFSPSDGATEVAVDANLVITFNEAVDVESGNIIIYDASNDSVVETIDVTSGLVTGTGTITITVNLSANLEQGENYYVQIDATAFDDAASNGFVGVVDETTWNFSTVPAPRSSSGSYRRVTHSIPLIHPTSTTPPTDCLPSYNFSPSTGVKCPTSNPTNPSEPSAFQFLTNLFLGMNHPDVLKLQQYLNAHGFTLTTTGPGSIDNETNMFGSLTKKALIKFQLAKGITPAVGYFGPVTRGVVGK